MQLRDFMCNCRPPGQAKCDALMERVYAELKTGPEDLLSQVVYTLQWGLREGFVGAITGIGCDMWSGVMANVSRYDKQGEEYVDHASIFVQCDRVEHGIARVYELAVESTKEGEHD